MAYQAFSYQEIPTYIKMNALADDISDNEISHNHTGGTSGKKLSWNSCWGDCIHHHSSDIEGGWLDWDLICASDPVHDHSSDENGGKLNWMNCFSDFIHDHSNNAEGGGLDWDLCWNSAFHDHSTGAKGGQFTSDAFADLAFTTPKITGMINSNFQDESIELGKLSTTDGEVSSGGGSIENLTLPGGQYGLYPRLDADLLHVGLADDISWTTYIANIRVFFMGTGYVRRRYFNY